MAVPMNSTGFRVIVEPIMNEHFDGVYTQRKDEYKAIFRVKPGIARAYHEEPVMFGLGSAPQMPDGTGVAYRQGGVLFNKRYVYKQWGAAFAMTKVLVEDGDHINLGKIYSEQLGQAMVETEELFTANVLNFSFTNSAPYLGGDGVSLINSAHPIVGGTQSNVLATPAALSQTSVEAMLIQIRKSQDNDQKRVRINPQSLVVSPDNEFQAEVILKSALRTGVANNDINPVMSLKILPKGFNVITRLTSPTAWWVHTDERMGLQMLTRRMAQKSMEGDFETDSMRYKVTSRWDASWTNWRCLYGTPGA
jgi:hypothetical protein